MASEMRKIDVTSSTRKIVAMLLSMKRRTLTT
jgi:hypothetical protein